MAIEEIIFVRNNLSPFEIKLAKTLKKKGLKLSSITFYELDKYQKGIFDNEYYFIHNNMKKSSPFRKILCFPKFYRSLREIKKGIAIGVTSSSNWFVAFVFWLLRRKTDCRIYFPYDIAFFKYKDYGKHSFFNRFSEKYNFRHNNGVIHKGPKDELKYLSKEFKALDKPDIQFLPYCDGDLFMEINDRYFQKKLSTKDGNIHLVYVGNVVYKNPTHLPFIDVFKEIIQQKMYIDAYATNYEQIIDDSEYKKLQKSKYFTLHKPIYEKKFQMELSEYDWGLTPAFHKFGKIKKEWTKVSTGSKMGTYLEAGLPIILNDELIFYADVIEENGFGIVVKPWTARGIKEKIESINYEKMVDSIKINRKKFTLDANMDRLINFIKDLADE